MKEWKGQVFMPTQTASDVKEQLDLQKQYNKPGAVPLEVYFSQRRIRGVKADMMRAYNKAGKIQRATMEDWDALFKSF